MKFNPGDVVYHKASHKRCVVVEMNEDKTIKIRDEDMTTHDCVEQELYSEDEYNNRNANLFGSTTESDYPDVF